MQISFHADRYTIIKYRCTLLPPPSQFRQFNTVSNSHLFPKDTNLHQHRCTNMNCHKPTFTVLSVTNTRTTFNCCWSFNWKRRTDGNFELSFITSALNTRELLRSRPSRFIPGEDWQCILTTRQCWTQIQSGSFGEDRKHSPLQDSNPGIVQPRVSTVGRLRRFSSRNLKLRSLVTYWQIWFMFDRASSM